MKKIILFLIALKLIAVIKSDYSFKDVTSNPYRILGVEPWSSMKDIKKKYNLLVLKYHPDKSTLPNAKEKFIEIQEAYEKIKSNRENQYEEKTFYDIVFEAIQTACIDEGIFFIVMYCCWFLYRLFYFIFRYGIFFIFYLFVNEMIIPHWFQTLGNSILTALICGLITYKIMVK